MGLYINGYYAFSPVTSTDHAGLLWVASLLSLLFSLSTLATRYHVRRRTFGSDDWLITFAAIAALAQYVSLWVGMDVYKLGRSSVLLSTDDAIGSAKVIFTSDCLFIVALGLSKASVILLIKRLFTRDFHSAWLICNILLGLVAAWVIASILILTINCGPESKLLDHRCTGQVVRWSIVAAIDGLFEASIMILSVVLVWPLQMGLDIKVSVVFAFFFRIGVIVFGSIHANRVASYGRSEDPGLAIVTTQVWQQIELGYALISATIPTLKSFIHGYEKAMGWADSYTKSHGDNTPGMFGTASFHMQSIRSMKSGGRSQDRDQHTVGDDLVNDDDNNNNNPMRLNLRPDPQKYNAKIFAHRTRDSGYNLRREDSTGSADSQNPIIRKDVHFTVSSETAPASPHPWSG